MAKYIAIKELIDLQELKIEKIGTKEMLADSLTKSIMDHNLQTFDQR